VSNNKSHDRRPGHRWANTQQTADYLGVTPRAVRLMDADGRLTAYYLGSRVKRFDLDEIDAAMVEGLKPPDDEAVARAARAAAAARAARAANRRAAAQAQTEKQCSRCGTTKHVSEFGADTRAVDGRRSSCKPCEADDARDRYAEKRTVADTAAG
jgi:hypothetical protein